MMRLLAAPQHCLCVFENGLKITKILDYEIADFGDSGVIDTAVQPILSNKFANSMPFSKTSLVRVLGAKGKLVDAKKTRGNKSRDKGPLNSKYVHKSMVKNFFKCMEFEQCCGARATHKEPHYTAPAPTMVSNMARN
jgi:hypothetical protein